MDKNRQQTQDKEKDNITHRPEQGTAENNLTQIVEVIDSLP